MTANEMHAIDQAMGIVEICTVCGNEHFAKSPICGDCAFIQWVEEQEQVVAEHINEPITWELV